MLLVAPVSAHAFHDGGVGSCSGCHVMHERADGELVVAGDALIGAATPTDVCLGCHATSAGGVFAQDPLAPGPELGGGNFAFLLEDDLADGPTRGWSRVPGMRPGTTWSRPARA